MAIYLGNLGRKTVNYAITHPWLNRTVDAFGKVAHIITFGNYTPGLTREALLLYQRTSHGDKITVKKDGFYRDGEKIAGNEYISNRISRYGATKFQRTKEDSPESITDYCRLNFRSESPFQTIKQTALYTLLFAAPDIFFKVFVNLTITAADAFPSVNKIVGWTVDPPPIGIFSLVNAPHHKQSRYIDSVKMIPMMLIVPFALYGSNVLLKHSSISLTKIQKKLDPIFMSAFFASTLTHFAEISILGFVTDYIDIVIFDKIFDLADVYLCTVSLYIFIESMIRFQHYLEKIGIIEKKTNC